MGLYKLGRLGKKILKETVKHFRPNMDWNWNNTLKEHQWIRTFAIFQRILISMDPYEISIFFPQNNLNDTSQFCEHILEIYIKICYNRDIQTTLRHFWIVSG